MPRRSRWAGCERCGFRGAACLCAEIPRLEPRMQVTVVRHALERHKQTNSVRWAQLALACEVVDYAADAAPFDPASLGLDGAWLLYPGGDAPPREAPARLIVPDGTWSQARRMVARIPGLLALPRLSVALPERPRLRKAPAGAGSTLEALAAAFALYEPHVGEQLAAVHAATLRRAERLRGYVELG